MKFFKNSSMFIVGSFLVSLTSCGRKNNTDENPRPQPAEVVVERIAPQAFQMSALQSERLNAFVLKPGINTCEQIDKLPENLKIKEVKYTFHSMGSKDQQSEFNVKSPGPDCTGGENGLSISVVREAKGGERPTPEVSTSFLFKVGQDKSKLKTLSVVTDCAFKMADSWLNNWKATKGVMSVNLDNTISNTYNTEICPAMISSVLDKILDQLAAIKG